MYVYIGAKKKKKYMKKQKKIYIYKGKESRTKQLHVLHSETIYMFDTQEIFINTEKYK